MPPIDATYLELLRNAGAKYGVPADLLGAQVSGESNFDANATSPMGAAGPSQFMPDTWAGSWNPYRNQSSRDPQYAIPAQALYMSRLKKQFGSWDLALAAYNAGSGAVEKYHGIPPYSETQNYVRTVNERRSRFPGLATSDPASTIPTGSQPERQPAGAPSIPTASTPGGGGGFGGGAAFAQAVTRQAFLQSLIDQTSDIAGLHTLALPAVKQSDYPVAPTSLPTSPTTTTPTPTTTPSPTTNSPVGTPGGGWGGSRDLAAALAQVGIRNGLSIASEKRDRKLTTSGNPSDHWVGSKNAYAYDLSNGSAPTPEMDATATQVAASLGVPNWHGGVLNVERDGYRYQVLYRTMVGGDHFNHVHLGVRRITP